MNGEFVYRGQNPNNYIKFANKTWRIVKIDKGGNFHLIENKVNYQKTAYWDNRYNSEAKASKGINTYTISRILNTLKNTYEKDYKSYQKYLTPANICVGKRPSAVSFNDGSVECSEIVSGQYLGLLPIYDYLNASLDNACLTVNSKECQNYNYLVDADSNWWTLTANPKSSYSVYYINSSGIVNTDEAAQPKPYRQVIYLNGDTLYKSGTGTASDPYVIR